MLVAGGEESPYFSIICHWHISTSLALKTHFVVVASITIILTFLARLSHIIDIMAHRAVEFTMPSHIIVMSTFFTIQTACHICAASATQRASFTLIFRISKYTLLFT